MKKWIFTVIAVLASTSAFAYDFDPSLPKPVQEQIRSDLSFMATIQGGQPTSLHQQIFGAIDGANYKQFFESRVTSVGYNSCGGGAAVACVIPWLGSSKIWMTDNYIKFSHPAIARLMIVYHETRHTEVQNDNWPHAYCPVPFRGEDGKEMKSIWTGAPLAGEPACDETPMGSYGSSTILLKNISLACTNCNEKVKMDAGIYADDQLGRITNQDAKQQMRRDFGQM